MNSLNKYTFSLTFLLISLSVFADDLKDGRTLDEAFIIKNKGFELPESVLHDTQSDTYLISNIGGMIPEKDDNGFISRVSPSGDVLELKWIDGASSDVTLHSPKGMALFGDRLYVADIDTIRVFNRETGKPMHEVVIKGSTFLNDIVVGSGGTAFTSESAIVFTKNGLKRTEKDAIYRISPDFKVSVLKKDKSLAMPNGLEIVGKDLLGVVSRGEGGFYILDGQGNKTYSVKLPVTKLDGLVQLSNNDFLASSWETSSVYRINKTGDISKVIQLPLAAANIGYDAQRKKLLLPMLKANQVAFLEVE